MKHVEAGWGNEATKCYCDCRDDLPILFTIGYRWGSLVGEVTLVYTLDGLLHATRPCFESGWCHDQW